MSESSVTLSLQAFVDQADQTIIDGEERLSRLVFLTHALAARGYDTRKLEVLRGRHAALLQSWEQRRSCVIEHLEERSDGCGAN